MVVTIPATQSGNGSRPVDPNRDLPQLIDLLRQVFGKELDAEGQQFMRSLPDSRMPALMWRLDPMLSRLAPGFVWERDGKIVGNVTLLPTRSKTRYLVANVGVLPAYQRQGIARMLMSAVQNEVHRRNGREIMLQVDFDNEAALNLYRSLGYDACGNMTNWRSSVSRVRDLQIDPGSGYYPTNVRRMDRSRWKEAYELDNYVLTSDLRWPEALEVETYKHSFWQRAADFLNGRFQHQWITLDKEQRINGLVGIRGEWGRPHQLYLRVHPLWRGRLERALLQKLIYGLRTLPRRNVQLVHPADDDVVNQQLITANFSRHRTLTHMRLGLR